VKNIVNEKYKLKLRTHDPRQIYNFFFNKDKK